MGVRRERARFSHRFREVAGSNPLAPTDCHRTKSGQRVGRIAPSAIMSGAATPPAPCPDNVPIRLRVVEPRRLAVLARRSGAMVASLSARAWHPRPVNACLAPIAHGADHDCRPHGSLLATSLFFRESRCLQPGASAGGPRAGWPASFPILWRQRPTVPSGSSADAQGLRLERRSVSHLATIWQQHWQCRPNTITI